MKLKSAVISIGNELLIGRTLNSNLAYLGAGMTELGIPVAYSLTIQDDYEAIQKAVHECWQNYDVVISTGGLGPTQDDITKAAIAEYFGKDMHFCENIWQHIQDRFAHRNVTMPLSNRSQAMVPEGFEALKNDRGTAPGLHYNTDGKHIFVLQGVPLEMRYMFENYIKPILKQAYHEAKGLVVRNLHTYGIAESALAELLDPKELPEGVSLAWLPQTGRVDLRLYGEDAAAIEIAEQYLHRQTGDYVWGYEDTVPAEYLLQLLKKKEYSLAVAESCTGGLVQRFITDIPGSSDVFLGGVVSYANRIKAELLKVDESILRSFGAVSEECARAMAQGIQRLLRADVVVAVTGIAGPDGGSTDKPVGTVYYCWRIQDKEYALHKVFNGDRESIRYKAAEAAILELANTLRNE
ncbi:MAG: competence/damage-inducible protein A [Candidatus Cloacimonetes bacterium]|nr:competence/damage-inducible protein A [Candidatus Cloacimonadota bacterium]